VYCRGQSRFGRTRSGQSLNRRKKKAFKRDGISRKVRGRIFLRSFRKPLPDFYGSHNKFLLFLPTLIWLFLFFPCTRETLGYLLCFLLCLPILAVSSSPCNLDKYPFCRRCKCTRQDRKENELPQR